MNLWYGFIQKDLWSSIVASEATQQSKDKQ